MKLKELIAYLVVVATAIAVVSVAVWLGLRKAGHYFQQETKAPPTPANSSSPVPEAPPPLKESPDDRTSDETGAQAKRPIYAPKPEYPPARQNGPYPGYRTYEGAGGT